MVDEPVFWGDEHGTWMAKEVLAVAPKARIMPVRIRSQKQAADVAGNYIKGIEYAVANGAQVISLSHQPILKERQGELDAAIEKAAQKGVVFVYIHYAGRRCDMVLTGPIEFASTHQKDLVGRVYTIGTHGAWGFPYTWGYSGTAPMVAGVVALIREINPRLSPAEIVALLRQTADTSVEGYPLVDAYAAVKKAQQ